MRIYVRMQRKNETERVNEGNRQGREMHVKNLQAFPTEK